MEELVKSMRLAPWIAGIVAALLAAPAGAQTGNLDAGKSPAQIFGDTCAGCHRSAREVRRASASFLRSHYTTGPQEATAMAQYLAGVGSDTRAGQPKETAKQTPAEGGKQNSRQQAADQAKGQPKGARPGTTAQARPGAAVEEKQPEPAAPPVPALEPFEE